MNTFQRALQSTMRSHTLFGHAASSPDSIERSRVFLEKSLDHERLRITLFCSLVALMSLVIGSFYFFRYEQVLAGAGSEIPIGVILLMSIAQLGIGLYALRDLEKRRARLDQHLQERVQPPSRRWQYLMCLIEASLPCLMLWSLYHSLPPAFAATSHIASVFYIIITLSVLRLDFWINCFNGALAAAAHLSFYLVYIAPNANTPDASFLLMPGRHVMQVLVYLVIGVVVGWISTLLRAQLINILRSERENAHVKGIFGQHVSPEVMRSLLNQEIDGLGEEREVSILFLDICDFTAFCERRSPSEVVSHLNVVFTILIDEINQHRGFVNKFLGDGLMAVFGAPIDDPNASRSAVSAAVAMRRALRDAMSRGTLEETTIRVGIHTGRAMTGNIGSAQRKEYTVVGDAVNLASRIESLNKRYESEILISGEVFNAIQLTPQADEFKITSIGPVQVKGRSEPVHLYQVT